MFYSGYNVTSDFLRNVVFTLWRHAELCQVLLFQFHLCFGFVILEWFVSLTVLRPGLVVTWSGPKGRFGLSR